MKIRIQVVIDHEDGQETPPLEEVACLQRGDLLPETLGLTLAEGKQLLAKLHRWMVQQQVETWVAQPQPCPHCRRKHTLKDDKPLTIRTVFGKFQLKSPRFYTCPCQTQKKHSFSPLASQLPERTPPELTYLPTKGPRSCRMG